VCFFFFFILFYTSEQVVCYLFHMLDYLKVAVSAQLLTGLCSISLEVQVLLATCGRMWRPEFFPAL
jgi:hypothetical protein